MKAFEIGKTYTGRYICDSYMIATLKIISRTAKTIKAEYQNKPITLRVKLWHDESCEYVNPDGVYSMALIIQAK